MRSPRQNAAISPPSMHVVPRILQADGMERAPGHSKRMRRFRRTRTSFVERFSPLAPAAIEAAAFESTSAAGSLDNRRHDRGCEKRSPGHVPSRCNFGEGSAPLDLATCSECSCDQLEQGRIARTGWRVIDGWEDQSHPLASEDEADCAVKVPGSASPEKHFASRRRSDVRKLTEASERTSESGNPNGAPGWRLLGRCREIARSQPSSARDDSRNLSPLWQPFRRRLGARANPKNGVHWRCQTDRS